MCLTIVGFWLATMSMLFYWEIWPQLQSDVAPPYSIDLVDEARHQDQTQIRWKVWVDEGHGPPGEAPLDPRDLVRTLPLGLTPVVPQAALCTAVACKEVQGQLFSASSSVIYREKPDDSFAFKLEFLPFPSRSRTFNLGIIHLKEMTSIYRVNRAGHLLEMDAKFKFFVDHRWIGDVTMDLHGEVKEGKFDSFYHLEAPLLGREFKQDLPQLDMTYQGSILLPLHPVNRIRGLRPGQTWRMPMLNPLQDALMASQFLGQSEVSVRYVNARVSPYLQTHKDLPGSIPCLVLDYDDKELQPRTWIQQSTGLVLRQEATPLPGKRVIMQRDFIVVDP
jgi:hypothetical protein